MNGNSRPGTPDGALPSGCWHDSLEGLQGVEDLEFDLPSLDPCSAMEDAIFECNAWPDVAGDLEACQPPLALYSPDMNVADMSTVPEMGDSLVLDNYLDFDAMNLADSNQGCSPLSSIPASSPEAPTCYSLPLGSVPYSSSVSPSLSLPSPLPAAPLSVVGPLFHSPVLSTASSLPPESTTGIQLSPFLEDKPPKKKGKVAHRRPSRQTRHEIRPERCPICYKGHPFQRELKEHIKHHHPSLAIRLEYDMSRPVCPLCSRSFARQCNVKRHMDNSCKGMKPASS